MISALLRLTLIKLVDCLFLRKKGISSCLSFSIYSWKAQGLIKREDEWELAKWDEEMQKSI